MIKEFILTNNSYFIRELRKSIKNIEIEERMDLLIHRPIGLVFSWGAIKLGLSPLHVSLLSLLTGVIAGVFFYWQNDLSMAVWGCVLLILSGILDTADGQVARLTNTSSKIGAVVDGLVDNGVFTSVYVFGMLYFFPHGMWIFWVAAVSGFMHSVHTQVYSYYKYDTSYYYCGQTTYGNMTAEEVKQDCKDDGFWYKFIYVTFREYVRTQNMFVTRKGETKAKFEKLAADESIQKEFREAYKDTFLPLLPWWALWGGTNTHRTLMMVCVLFAHFDYYMYLNILMTLPMIYLTIKQAKLDKEFLTRFSE